MISIFSLLFLLRSHNKKNQDMLLLSTKVFLIICCLSAEILPFCLKN